MSIFTKRLISQTAKGWICLIVIIFIFSITSCAQTKFTQGVVKGKKDKYEVVKSDQEYNKNRHLFIYPGKNKFNGPVPLPNDKYEFKVLKKDIHVDIEKVKAIVYDVLRSKKQSLHDSGELLGIRFIFETNGTLADNNYTVIENSLITPAEIEEIDNKLRQNIEASFTGKDYTHYTAVDYSFPFINF